MKMNKKQEKAVSIAIQVMEAVLDKGIDSGEDGRLDFAINELIAMKDKSIVTKAKEKAKKKYLDNLLKNSNTVTLDGKWYDENVRKS